MKTKVKINVSSADMEAIRVATEALRTVACGLDAPNGFWVGGGDAGFSYCGDCCEVEVARLKLRGDDVYIDGGWGADESDSCVHCETCGKVLNYSLTEYGIDSELDHFEEYGIRESQEEAYHFLQVIEAGGGDPDVYPEMVGRVARLAKKYLKQKRTT